jgi:pyridoxamine 5'-phosphate oxidase
MSEHAGLPDLDDHILDADPVKQFTRWYQDAVAAHIPEPDAMTLATANRDGIPSARMVLLKKADEHGFVFFTNYNSHKGQDMLQNPRAALVFFWPGIQRQVRVEGTVSRLPANESDSYFATRPRESQLSSLTSLQSKPIASREDLDKRFEELKLQFEGKPIPRPSHWGGYRVQPLAMEFWQSRFARMNDRILYTRQQSGRWVQTRLQP